MKKYVVWLIIIALIWSSVFFTCMTLATPVISAKMTTEHGTMYQHKSGRMVFIPKSDTGLFADDQAKAIWLATCVKDSSKFSLNGYLKVAVERNK